MNLLVKDVIHHIEVMKETYPDTPIFIFGFSMVNTVNICFVLIIFASAVES